LLHRILIVDDHPLYREGMIGALRAQLAGVEVLGVGSAEEGLKALEREPETDLVLIDVRLPGMNGFGALALYAERFPAVSCMLISGRDDDHARLARRAFEAGASGFIPKSMPVDQVCSAIRKVLEGGIYDPAEIPTMPRMAQPEASIERLTLRQFEALSLLGKGFTNREIAEALAISERTARAHVAAILKALGVENRTQAVVAAQRLGLLPQASDPA
jgi:DNA-binding NarL/FixJ family response regulator